MTQDTPADILIVDDTPANLQLLAGLLKKAGHRVRPVPSGRMALRAARAARPDLILLDIMMPEMDGYEVCRQLEADPELADVPVIFISALDAPEDKVRAFSAGGVDYVSKPFHFEEVQARVQTHLRISRLQRKVQHQNRELEANNAQLQELEAQRDSLVHMLVHDMRSPLGSMQMFLEVLRDDTEDVLDEDQHEDLAYTLDAIHDLAGMIDAILDVSRLEEAGMPLNRASQPLHPILERAAHPMEHAAREHRLLLPEGPGVTLCCDDGLIARVVTNLVANALKFTPRGGLIELRTSSAEGMARVEVRDQGPGIPTESRDLIFDKFGQVRGRHQHGKRSTGLGLAFCKLAVEAHGGRIGVHRGEGGSGSIFWFELPLVLPEEP